MSREDASVLTSIALCSRPGESRERIRRVDTLTRMAMFQSTFLSDVVEDFDRRKGIRALQTFPRFSGVRCQREITKSKMNNMRLVLSTSPMNARHAAAGCTPLRHQSQRDAVDLEPSQDGKGEIDESTDHRAKQSVAFAS